MLKCRAAQRRCLLTVWMDSARSAVWLTRKPRLGLPPKCQKWGAGRVSGGRLFHARSAATGKEWSPRVAWRVDGTCSVAVSAEWRQRRHLTAAAGCQTGTSVLCHGHNGKLEHTTGTVRIIVLQSYCIEVHQSSANAEHGRMFGQRLWLGHASTFGRTSVIIRCRLRIHSLQFALTSVLTAQCSTAHWSHCSVTHCVALSALHYVAVTIHQSPSVPTANELPVLSLTGT